MFSSKIENASPDDWYAYQINTTTYAVLENRNSAHFGMFMNDAFSVTGNNARISYSRGEQKAYVVATRNIKPGEMICVAYGRSYWVEYLSTFQCRAELKVLASRFYEIKM